VRAISEKQRLGIKFLVGKDHAASLVLSPAFGMALFGKKILLQPKLRKSEQC